MRDFYIHNNRARLGSNNSIRLVRRDMNHKAKSGESSVWNNRQFHCNRNGSIKLTLLFLSSKNIYYHFVAWQFCGFAHRLFLITVHVYLRYMVHVRAYPISVGEIFTGYGWGLSD